MKKFLNYFILLINAKWIFQKPTKKKYFICSQNEKVILTKILKENYFFLDDQNRNIYLYIFFRTILDFSFKKFLYKYYLNIIKEVNPEIIISTVDTKTFFWELKNYFPNKKIILIQNAKKTGNSNDLFTKLRAQNFKRQKIDHIFLMNNTIKEEFKKFIDGEFIIHGSLRNNDFKRKNIEKDDYVFISQISDYGNQVFDDISKKKISEIFFFESKKILEYFSKYKPNKKINILPYNFNRKLFDFEKSLFREISDELDLEIKFLNKRNNFDSYYLLDSHNCSIGITSTLLYENLARGNKTGFFNYLKSNNIDGYSINWPSKESETVISTEKNDYENFIRIIKYLDETSKSDWDKNIDKLKENIMAFDEDNKKFRKLIIDLN